MRTDIQCVFEGHFLDRQTYLIEIRNYYSRPLAPFFASVQCMTDMIFTPHRPINITVYEQISELAVRSGLEEVA